MHRWFLSPKLTFVYPVSFGNMFLSWTLFIVPVLSFAIKTLWFFIFMSYEDCHYVLSMAHHLDHVTYSPKKKWLEGQFTIQSHRSVSSTYLWNIFWNDNEGVNAKGDLFSQKNNMRFMQIFAVYTSPNISLLPCTIQVRYTYSVTHKIQLICCFFFLCCCCTIFLCYR